MQDILWKSAEEFLPAPGAFVELKRNEGKPFDRVYWCASNYRPDGLHWRYVPAPNFLGVAAEPVERLPITEDFWYVVLCQPQQELPAQWRLHELSLELYVPIIRKRVKTGRTGKNGHKVTRVHPRPMFPGYGLVRKTGIGSVDDLKAVRGVHDVMRDENRKPVTLPHEAVLAIFRKQSQKHHDFHQEYSWRQRPRFKPNDAVRIEAEGNVYDGQLATIEKDDGASRIKVLLGLARIPHSLPAEMVVAA